MICGFCIVVNNVFVGCVFFRIVVVEVCSCVWVCWCWG